MIVTTLNFDNSESQIGDGVVGSIATPVHRFVHSGTTVQNVVTADRDQRVMTSTASHDVVASQANQNIMSTATIDQFVGSQRNDQVVTAGRQHEVCFC